MRRLLEALGLIVSRDVKRRIRAGKVVPSSNNGGTTLVRSAKLVNSIHHIITGEKVDIGSNLVYARIHHEGGTIKPVRAKYLAIPLTKEAAVRRPRDWADTFIAKGVIFRNTGGGEIEALYALKKQVQMPARPYMFIDQNTRDSMRALAVDYIGKETRGK